MINIVKIGGNVVDNEEALGHFLNSISNIKSDIILAHGGGKIATKISKALNIETKMIAGRRVTDEETLKVVTMVYAGLVNKTIVSKLQARDVNAMGFSGADGNIIRSHKRIESDVDYGFVGDVDEVDGELLVEMIVKGYMPVLAPITHDKRGLLLNTNADTIAAETAKAISRDLPVRLIYCFELPGVLEDINDPESLISEIDEERYQELKANGVISDGMIPKLDNCFDAINAGVQEVVICEGEEIENVIKGKGLSTRLLR